MRATLLLAASLALASFAASAMTIEDLTPGKTVVGPELSTKDLKGKVVFVDLWGIH